MTFRTTFRETCRSRQISLIAFFWEKQARRNKHSNPGLPVVGKVNWNLAPPGFRLDANQPRNLSLFHEKLRAPLDNQRFLRREASLPGLENSHSVELTTFAHCFRDRRGWIRKPRLSREPSPGGLGRVLI